MQWLKSHLVLISLLFLLYTFFSLIFLSYFALFPLISPSNLIIFSHLFICFSDEGIYFQHHLYISRSQSPNSYGPLDYAASQYVCSL